MKDLFRKIATKVSNWTGSASAFLLAVFVVIVWALTGPTFNYSNTWQLIINTGTTIGTFLMVFLIQNTQNRDGKALQLKLDEIIRTTKARDAFVDLEDLSDAELDQLNVEFKLLHDRQVTSPTMKKLHAKIEEAHSHRSLLQNTISSAGNAIGKINSIGNKKINL